MCELKKLLATKGQIFLCGPAQGTNREIIDLINELAPGGKSLAHPIADFVPAAGPGRRGNPVSSHGKFTAWLIACRSRRPTNF